MPNVSMQETKIGIKKQIMAAINRDGAANKAVLAASIALEHGLSSRTVKYIIDDMIKAMYIKEENELLKACKGDPDDIKQG